MPNLVWYDSYKTGLAEIDDDHKNLLHVMSCIQAAIQSQDIDQCSSLMAELIKAAKQHFSREEDYLRRQNYPDIEEHITYHSQLIIKAEAVKAMCERNSNGYEIEECFNDMADFLIDDVLHGDVEFMPFLESRGLI